MQVGEHHTNKIDERLHQQNELVAARAGGIGHPLMNGPSSAPSLPFPFPFAAPASTLGAATGAAAGCLPLWPRQPFQASTDEPISHGAEHVGVAPMLGQSAGLVPTSHLPRRHGVRRRSGSPVLDLHSITPRVRPACRNGGVIPETGIAFTLQLKGTLP